MRLPVSVAGWECDWTFADSSLLERWLRARPWIEGGGLRVLRCSGGCQAAVLLDAIDAAILAADRGASDVRVRRLDSARLAGGVEAFVGELLGGVAPRSRREATELCARELSLHAHVAVLDAADCTLAEAAHRIDLLMQVSEEVAKVRPRARLCSVVLVAPDVAPAEECFDLREGAPSDAFGGRRLSGAIVRWRSYVHARVAWEIGGRLECLSHWDTELRSVMNAPDDGVFESALNKAADGAWNSVPPSLQDAVHWFLKGPSRDHRSGAIDAMVSHGLLWGAARRERVRPSPWVCRALLRSSPAHPSAPLLRSELVCGPIRRDVVARCLELEAVMRVVHSTDVVELPSDQRAIDVRMFRSASGSFDRQFYPTSAPAIDAMDAWSFATFGEFLSCLDLDSERLNHLHILRQLRNSVAHGHYVSWRTVELLKSLERLLLA